MKKNIFKYKFPFTLAHNVKKCAFKYECEIEMGGIWSNSGCTNLEHTGTICEIDFLNDYSIIIII